MENKSESTPVDPQLLIDTVFDYAIFALDAQGFILTWNQGGKRLKGYESHEIIGKHFSIFYSEADKAHRHPEFELREAVKNGSYEEEGWRIKKDGSRFWSSVVITALREPDGTLIGFGKVTRDLTARKQAEDKLRESEERFRLLVSSVKDYAIIMLDVDGNVILWNEGAQRIKGYSAEEIIGQNFRKFYPPEDLQDKKPDMELEMAIKTGRFEDLGWRVRKDGTMFWANVVLTAIFEKNKLMGFSKVTRDLTERKVAEDRLKMAHDQLERRVEQRTAELEKTKNEAQAAVKVRDEFLSIASHELKTPLTSLKLQAQIRRRYLQKDGISRFTYTELEKLFTSDENQYDRLRHLVDDMLDISRITSGKLSLSLEPVGLNQLLRELLGQYASQFEQSSVDYRFLPSESEITGDWDKYRLEQIITNLFNNALKYGEGKPITVITLSDSYGAEVRVQDQGMGIAPENLTRVFEQFERAVSGNAISGLGLGLYISTQIAAAHGGKLWVESELGKGSVFILRLPFEATPRVS